MSKKTRRKTPATPATPAKKSTWIWAAVAGAALLVFGGLAVLFTASNSTPADFTPEVSAAPVLQVSQPVIDEGDVKLGETKRTVFTLKNVGDKPLKILGEPQVQLVEGC